MSTTKPREISRQADYPAPRPPLTQEDLAEGFARPRQACREVLHGSMSESQLYKLLGAGVIASVRVGRSRLIPVRRLKNDVASGRLANWREQVG